jgi:hypothetical protein
MPEEAGTDHGNTLIAHLSFPFFFYEELKTKKKTKKPKKKLKTKLKKILKKNLFIISASTDITVKLCSADDKCNIVHLTADLKCIMRIYGHFHSPFASLSVVLRLLSKYSPFVTRSFSGRQGRTRLLNVVFGIGANFSVWLSLRHLALTGLLDQTKVGAKSPMACAKIRRVPFKDPPRELPFFYFIFVCKLGGSFLPLLK